MREFSRELNSQGLYSTSKGEGKFSWSFVHALHKTSHWAVSRLSRAADVIHAYSCFILLVRPFAFFRLRCRYPPGCLGNGLFTPISLGCYSRTKRSWKQCSRKIWQTRCIMSNSKATHLFFKFHKFGILVLFFFFIFTTTSRDERV